VGRRAAGRPDQRRNDAAMVESENSEPNAGSNTGAYATFAMDRAEHLFVRTGVGDVLVHQAVVLR
jgi:hypothetical protein